MLEILWRIPFFKKQKDLYVFYFFESSATHSFRLNYRVFFTITALGFLFFIFSCVSFYAVYRQHRTITLLEEQNHNLKKTLTEEYLKQGDAPGNKGDGPVNTLPGHVVKPVAQSVVAAPAVMTAPASVPNSVAPLSHPSPSAPPVVVSMDSPAPSNEQKVVETTVQAVTATASMSPLRVDKFQLIPMGEHQSRVGFILSRPLHLAIRSVTGSVCVQVDNGNQGAGFHHRPGSGVYPWSEELGCAEALPIRFSRRRPTHFILPLGAPSVQKLRILYKNPENQWVVIYNHPLISETN